MKFLHLRNFAIFESKSRSTANIITTLFSFGKSPSTRKCLLIGIFVQCITQSTSVWVSSHFEALSYILLPLVRSSTSPKFCCTEVLISVVGFNFYSLYETILGRRLWTGSTKMSAFTIIYYASFDKPDILSSSASSAPSPKALPHPSRNKRGYLLLLLDIS